MKKLLGRGLVACAFACALGLVGHSVVSCSESEQATAPAATGDTGVADTATLVDDSESDGPRPDVRRDGASDATIETEPEDLPVEPVYVEHVQARAKGDGRLGNAFGAATHVMHAFVSQNPTLDLLETPEANTAKIRTRIKEQTAPCSNATLSADTGSATMTVTFGGGDAGSCTLQSGVAISGTVSVTVSVLGLTMPDAGPRRDGGLFADAGAAKTLVVSFTFTGLTVTINSETYTMDGVASMSTSDLKTYGVTLTKLAVGSLGTIDFAGTTTVGIVKDAGVPDAAADAIAVVLAATLNGDGGVAGGVLADVGGAVEAGAGWSCTASSTTAYSIDGLHKDSRYCAPDNGVLTFVRPGSCTKGTKSIDYANTYTLTFDSSSATTGVAKLAYTFTISGITTKPVTSTVTMPTCP